MVGPVHLHGCPNHTAEPGLPGLPPCLMPPLPRCCLACIAQQQQHNCGRRCSNRSSNRMQWQQRQRQRRGRRRQQKRWRRRQQNWWRSNSRCGGASDSGWGDSSGGGAKLRQMGLSSAWRWWRQVRPMDGASQHQYHFCHNLMHVTVVGASQPMGPQPWGSCTCDACHWPMRGPQMNVWGAFAWGCKLAVPRKPHLPPAPWWPLGGVAKHLAHFP